MPRVVLASPITRWLPNAKPGERSFQVEGTTVRAVLEQLFIDAPTLRGYLLDDQGGLRHHVAAFVNGVVVCDKQNLHEEVPLDGEVYLAQALSGG